jgi:hypothetical protein
LQQPVVVLVEKNRSAGQLFELYRAAYVINMRVRYHNLGCAQGVPLERRHYHLNVVAGINDNRFTSGFIADYRAVALQRSYGKNFVDHSLLCDEGGAPSSSRKGLAVGPASSYLLSRGVG